LDQVQYIIETVVDQLADNPDRKFIQVEQGFFFLWWQQQGETMRNRVRKLVASGQLEFINGGWVMHDEAVCHYTDMVHQMSMGHRFIQEHFNITPRVAWQIDPFGHSATQASLITSQGGLDAFIFGRADYKDMEKRKAEQKMEFVWRAGTGAPRDTQVFTGILYDGYYSPQEFRYQQTDSPEYRFRDWPNERNPNVEQFVNFFVQETLNRARAFRTNHLLFPMGEDFSFNEAIMWFKNMDKLIHYVNLDGRVNALYSTPSLYVDAVQKENKTWPLKTGDMFPYADAPNFVWTGYFASRANFKRFARACSSLLLATTILEAAVGKTALRDWGLKTHRMIATDEFLFDNHLGKNLKPTSGTEGAERGGAVGEGGGGGSGEGGVGGNVESGEWEEWERVGAGARRRRVASTFPLEEAVAVAQHHDAITGTAQQHVNDDYTIRLHRATQEVRKAGEGGGGSGGKSGMGGLGGVEQQVNVALMASTVVAAALVHLITQAAPTTLPPRSSSPTSSSTPQDPSRAFFTPTADPTMGPSDFPPFNDPTLDPAAQLQAQPWDPVSSPSVLVTDSSNSPIPAQIVTETLVDPNTRAFYVAAYTGQLPQEPQQSQQQPQQPGQQEGQMDGAQQQQEGRQMSVVFRAEVPPLGYTTFFLTAVPPGTQGAAVISTTESAEVPALKDPTGTPNSANTANSPAQNIVLGGFKADSSSAGGAGGAAGKGTGAGKEGESALRVTFTKAAYGMTQMELVRQTDGEQVTVDVAQPVRSDVLEYVTQKGGAYIFDPTAEATNPTQRDDRVSIRVQRGPIVEEFSRQVAPWISETFRVYPGCDYAELHYVIGPTPEDSKGHEVVTRFSAPINSNKTFFTDSNGRRYLKRIVDHRADWELTVTDPIAGNFYPVTVGAFIGDGESQLSLLVDRAAGAASLGAGQLEVMLHRALVTVDMKGVGEILNEQIAFNGNNERLMVIGSIRFGLHPGGSTGVAEEEHDEEQPTATTSAVAPADADAATATPHGRRGAETDGGGGKEEANQGFSEMGRPRERRGGERQEGEGGGKGQGAEWRRVHAQRLIAPLQLAFAVETKEAIRAAEASHRWRYSISQGERAINSRTPKSAYSLPPNVAVISFQPQEGSGIETPCSADGDTRESDAVTTATAEPTGRGEACRAVPAAVGVGGAGSVTVDYSLLMKRMVTTGFQATCLGQAINEVNRMLSWRLSDDPPKPDDTEEERDPAFRSSVRCKIFLGFTSNLMSSGLRETFCFLAKHKLVDVIVTTAGGIEEDVIKCLAPTLLGDFSLAGKDLRAKGLNRIGNLLVPNNNYCLFEDWVLPVLDACLEEQKTQNGIPVLCPAITDGSLGDMIYFHSWRMNSVSPHPNNNSTPAAPLLLLLLSSPSSPPPLFPPDIRRMNGEAVNATPRQTGVIILGGGLPKHHICNANMMRNGADYAVYINTASEFDGSDSGARPDEANSHVISPIPSALSPISSILHFPLGHLQVYCDATIAFPLLVAETFAPHLQERVQQQEQAKQEVQAKE
ncbi:unnamed protein product, partial [Closterium sp. Naga37s-1]